MDFIKDLFWAYLFLAFFGIFGAHQFYMKRPYYGLFYLFTAGFFGILVVIDIFTLPFQLAAARR